MLLQKLDTTIKESPSSESRWLSASSPRPRSTPRRPRSNPRTTKLMKIRRKSSEWHVQKNGDVALMQNRVGVGKDGKPASETALVARTPGPGRGVVRGV